MNATAQYAFYGSLRKGMINYERYKDGLEYLFSARLKGFRLFSMGEYPCAVEAPGSENSIVVEVFKVKNPAIEREIYDMELSVGYHFKEVRINHQLVGIYLYAAAGNYPEVIGGDWVDFFWKNENS
jgi:gamma-glutamylcyclotransferase (GGCT)/AIG2-like uncharacterized protein YtfP